MEKALWRALAAALLIIAEAAVNEFLSKDRMPPK